VRVSLLHVCHISVARRIAVAASAPPSTSCCAHLKRNKPPLCPSARRLLVVACLGCRPSESHLLRKCCPTLSFCSIFAHVWLDSRAVSPVLHLDAVALLPDRQTRCRTVIRVEPLHQHSSCIHALASSGAHITQIQTTPASAPILLLMLTILQTRPADSSAEYPRAKSYAIILRDIVTAAVRHG
jgi:hypothetical protein